MQVNLDESGVSYSYDEQGNVISARDNAGRNETYTYNNVGEITKIHTPDNKNYTYTYAAGNKHRLVSATSGSSGVKTGLTYDAWGKCTVTNAGGFSVGRDNPFRYRGYYYDAETGFYYLNSRYYNPEWGRFISPDVFVSTGQGLTGANMFAYCGNNPVNGEDQGGLLPRNCIHVNDGGSRGGGPTVYTPINGQKLEPYASMAYGNSTIGYAGCEAIACYNAMLLLGMGEAFESVKSFFTNRFSSKWFTHGWAVGGSLGATRWDVAAFLRSRGLQYYGADEIRNFIPHMYGDKPGVFIISYWNDPLIFPVFSGCHTVAINYDGANFTAYNFYMKSQDLYTRTDLHDFMKDTGGFYYGFFIPRT